jgi:hypothetical protein
MKARVRAAKNNRCHDTADTNHNERRFRYELPENKVYHLAVNIGGLRRKSSVFPNRVIPQSAFRIPQSAIRNPQSAIRNSPIHRQNWRYLTEKLSVILLLVQPCSFPALPSPGRG